MRGFNDFNRNFQLLFFTPPTLAMIFLIFFQMVDQKLILEPEFNLWLWLLLDRSNQILTFDFDFYWTA